MGKNLTPLILIWLLFFCVRSSVTAQKVVSTLSTKAGTVTYTEGKPALFTKRKISSQVTSLGPGDNLQTQARDRIEIELNPGSYLRIGGRARVTVLETVLDRMHFQIDEGVVIVDTGTLDRQYHSLQLSSPSGDFRIAQKGLYRVEVNDSGIVEVLVHKGSVECWRGSQKIATLRSGKHYQLKGSGDSSFLQSSLVGRKKDSIDEWSQSRSNYLKGGPFGKGHPRSRSSGF
jgi:hypothetical protein